MALPSFTTKVVGSDTEAERKVLYSDLNQLKQALQVGTLDIKPLDAKLSGTNLFFNDSTVGVRYNTGTNKIQFSNDGSTWSDISSEGVLNTTVTAGENLAIRDLVYFNSGDGKVYKCDADDATKVDWVGVMQEAVLADATGTMYTNSAIVGGFTGLTTGANYYVSSTAGAVASSGAYKVGVAISTTELKLVKDTNEWALIETLSPSGVATVTTSATLTPYNEFKIEFYATLSSGNYQAVTFDANNVTAGNWERIFHRTNATATDSSLASCPMVEVTVFGGAAIKANGVFYVYSDASDLFLHGTSNLSAVNANYEYLLNGVNNAVTSKATTFTFTTDGISGTGTSTFQSGTVIRIYAK